MKKIKAPLYIQILIAMVIGLLWALTSFQWSNGREITLLYIKPIGTIFLNMLQMIAIPIILTSLITGIASIKDLTRLSRIGGKTVALFICTALTATTLGVVIGNVVQPGKHIDPNIKKELLAKYEGNVESSVKKLEEQKDGPLSPLVNIFPKNIFKALSDNQTTLQVVFFALLFGVGLSKVQSDKTDIIVKFFEGLNEIFIKLVQMIMTVAPIGVFALVASVIIEFSGESMEGALNLLQALIWYCLAVVFGLVIILFIIYPAIIRVFSDIGYKQFFKGMRPAFLLAFSSSSSSATLPVTMERVEKHLHIPEEITGFVLPFGTSINMDGTALYQCVAAMFIGQAFGIELTLIEQITIVLTATLAAMGAAGVPGVGMITLIVVLKGAGIPIEGIALIMAPDRLLDMCRTVINVAGDATAAVVVAGTESKK